jgi:hypothetical protein
MVGVCSLYSLKRLRNDHQNTVKNGIDTGITVNPTFDAERVFSRVWAVEEG